MNDPVYILFNIILFSNITTSLTMSTPGATYKKESKTCYCCYDEQATSAATADMSMTQAHLPSFNHLFAFLTWANCNVLVMGLASAISIGAIKTGLAVVLGRVFVAITNFGSGAVLGQQTLEEVTYWCVVLAGIGATGWLAYFAFMFAWITFGEQQARQIRTRILHVLLRKDMTWLDSREHGIDSLLVRIQTYASPTSNIFTRILSPLTGKLTSVNRQIREVQTASSLALGSLSMDIATAVGNIIVAFYFSWKLTLVILATVPVSLAALDALGRNLKSAIRAHKAELARASKYAAAALASIDLVKAFNGVDLESWKYMRSTRDMVQHYLVQVRAHAAQLGYTKFWVECIFVLGFYYGVVLVHEGASPGHVLTTFYAALAALQAAEAFVPKYLLLVRGMSAGLELRRVTEDFQDGRKIRRRTGILKPSTCAGDIEINNVSSTDYISASFFICKK